MTPPNSKLRLMPLLRELHQQWFENRGAGVFQRPFSRDWEGLLESAGIRSAEERQEAARDAQVLEAAQLIELRMEKNRAAIKRVLIPLAAEARLREAFPEFEVHRDDLFDWDAIAWEPELRTIAQARVTTNSGDLVRMNDFFKNGGRTRPVVPIKERSLEIFGDEKRLDDLRLSALFRPDRLALEDFRCQIVGEPFGWKRGPRDTGRIVVLENAATWHSYCRWNAERRFFSAVVYGCGNRFRDNIPLLADILGELSAPQEVYYFGDLDCQGLRIPVEASLKAVKLGLPAIRPDLWSYQQLLALGQGREGEAEPSDAPGLPELSWLGQLAKPVEKLLLSNKRLAQECVGWEFLCQQTSWSP